MNIYNQKCGITVFLLVFLLNFVCSDIHRIILRPEKKNKEKYRISKPKSNTRIRGSPHHDHITSSSIHHSHKQEGWTPVQNHIPSYLTSSKPYENQLYKPTKKGHERTKSLVDLIEITTSRPRKVPYIQSDYMDYSIPKGINIDELVKSVVKKPSAHNFGPDPMDYKVPKATPYIREHNGFSSLANNYAPTRIQQVPVFNSDSEKYPVNNENFNTFSYHKKGNREVNPENIPSYEVHEDVYDYNFPRQQVFLNLAPTSSYVNLFNSTKLEEEKDIFEQSTRRPFVRKQKKQKKTTYPQSKIDDSKSE